ncbi:2'-5' RNA ligase family protein [Streptosporangium sp. NPDC002524]|uniref:2'-5' RNA ligase family protein n=1 Tax=Streptosporangium sp. NPDC002524 TaxID=3154537 RepID=UPI00332ACB69
MSVTMVDGLEHKAISTSAASAETVVSDEDLGVVEAYVSITGVVDNVGDLIVPGAYARTLAVRRPKGIKSHDTKIWTSRAEVIEELLPGDPRLPSHTKDGKPWPRAAGALYVRCRYNLATSHGRDAFEDVKFYGKACEWSIGYQVPRGGSRKDPKTGVRYIKDLDLWEYSQVLWGAAGDTMTLSVKSGLPGEADTPSEWDDDDDLLAPAWQEKAATGGGSVWDELLDAAAADDGQGELDVDDAPGDGGDGGDAPSEGPSAMIALTIPADVAEQLALPDGHAPEELHITLAYLGRNLEPDVLAKAAAVAEQVAASHGPLDGTLGGIGAFPPEEDGVPVYVPVDVPGLEVLRQRLVEALGEAGVPYSATHGFTPHVTLIYAAPGEALPSPLSPVDVAFAAVTLTVAGTGQDFALTADAPPEAAGAAAEAKASGQADEDWELKAGRVLSDANGKKLRQAVEILHEVLLSAGISHDPTPVEPPKPSEPVLDSYPSVMPDSTAPSALPMALKQQNTAETPEAETSKVEVVEVTEEQQAAALAIIEAARQIGRDNAA